MYKVLKACFFLLIVVISFESGFLVGSQLLSTSSSNKQLSQYQSTTQQNSTVNLESRYVTKANKGIISKISEISNIVDKKIVTNAQLRISYKGQVSQIDANNMDLDPGDPMFIVQIMNPTNKEKDYSLAVYQRDLSSITLFFKKNPDGLPVHINPDDLKNFVRLGDPIQIDCIQDIDKIAPSSYTITKLPLL